MAVRVVVGLALVGVFVLILIAPPWVLPLAIAAVSAMAAYELLYATGAVRRRWIVALAAVFAAGVPLWFYFDGDMGRARLACVLFVFVLFGAWMSGERQQLSFAKVAIILFAALVVPLFFSSLIGIMQMPNGKFYFVLPFIAAFMTDTSAYFAGRAFGKHKLAPTISPQKTVEGAVGGVVGAMALTWVYGFAIQRLFDVDIRLFPLILFTLAGSIVAQMGDLSMSLIKREYNIKDFGKLLPGHGGVLDRLDSLLFVAPMMEALLFVFSRSVAG